MDLSTKYIHIYLEYHNVCPLVRIGTPSPASECVHLTPPPPESPGGHTRLGGGGGEGSQFERQEKTPSMNLFTLWIYLS
jgi:hypothetical protein